MVRLFICFFLFFSAKVFAQDLFQFNNLSQALPIAAGQKKLIFLQLESRDCSLCNESAMEAFSDKNLQEKIAASFVTVLVSAGSASWQDYATSFRSANGGATLFLDEFGTLVYRYNNSSSNPSVYSDQMKQALARRTTGATLRSLENKYRDGDRTAGSMESLLLARNRVSLETDSLLDTYVKNISPDSLKSRRVILFIARMSPVLGSSADTALRKNAEFFSQCWFSIPADQRVAINNNIIRKSKLAAIAHKDVDAAYLAAAFAKSTYFDNYNSQRIYDQTMIEYFREAADTAKYIPMAVYYYDNYFMSVPVDSIRVIDTLKLRDFAAKLTNAAPPTLTTELYSNQLKNAAWSFYKMTTDSAALSRALNWAKRANEFSESGSSLDVYARLLYHFGDRKSGIESEENAIEEFKRKGQPVDEQEGVLKKMKENSKNL